MQLPTRRFTLYSFVFSQYEPEGNPLVVGVVHDALVVLGVLAGARALVVGRDLEARVHPAVRLQHLFPHRIFRLET